MSNEPEPIKAKQPNPRNLMPRKSVWNDVKGRTWVCFDVWENAAGYSVDMMQIGGPKVIEFFTRPWMEVYRAIDSGAMSRANV